MVKINLSLPIDSTFLSETMYEGILFSIVNSKLQCNFNLKTVDIKSDFLSRAYERLDEKRINDIGIRMSGNDNINIKIFEKLGLREIESSKSYRDLITLLKAYNKNMTSKKEINLKIATTKKYLFIDIKSKVEGLSAPQLLKVDRYTGITSLDFEYASQKLTFYFSKEAALTSLLGIYSSFIVSIRQQQQTYYYFLFFSPDEIAYMLSVGKMKLIEKYFLVKNKTIKVLKKVIEKSPINELIIAEIALNLELQQMMIEENLDKISLLLFKISPEGQTYKIYEQIPITIFRENMFYRIAEKYFHDPIKISKHLMAILSPNNVILETLSTLNRATKAQEADNLLKAVQNLYKFVILGDLQGWFSFLREMWNAHEKRKNSEGRSKYLTLIKSLAYA